MKTPFKSKFQITQRFGVNPDTYKVFGLQGHEGIDLVPTGSDWTIYSLTDGYVVKDEDNPKSGNYGKNCTIWCPSLKVAFQYCHMNDNYISYGDHVEVGQKLGTVGSTGNTTGPHLHLNMFMTDEAGIRLNRDNGFFGGVDPLPFLERDDVPVINTQAQLDQLREERDHNWTLYQDALKKRDELEKQLQAEVVDHDGCRQELTSYKAIVRTYADMLGVGANETEKIGGEIKRLIGKEDQFQSMSKTVDTMLGEMGTLQNENSTLKTENAQLTQERNDSRTSFEMCRKEVDHMASKLTGSESFSLNKTDWEKWVKNALLFGGPALLVLLASAVQVIPADWKYAAVALWAINTGMDLLRKYIANNKS